MITSAIAALVTAIAINVPSGSANCSRNASTASFDPGGGIECGAPECTFLYEAFGVCIYSCPNGPFGLPEQCFTDCPW